MWWKQRKRSETKITNMWFYFLRLCCLINRLSSLNVQLIWNAFNYVYVFHAKFIFRLVLKASFIKAKADEKNGIVIIWHMCMRSIAAFCKWSSSIALSNLQICILFECEQTEKHIHAAEERGRCLEKTRDTEEQIERVKNKNVPKTIANRCFSGFMVFI